MSLLHQDLHIHCCAKPVHNVQEIPQAKIQKTVEQDEITKGGRFMILEGPADVSSCDSGKLLIDGPVNTSHTPVPTILKPCRNQLMCQPCNSRIDWQLSV